MNSDRIWTLLARKLAEEISPEELAELEVLLKENPHVHLKIQTVEESWNKNSYSDEENNEIAYQQLTGKLKQQGFNILASEDSEHSNDLPISNKNRPARFRQLMLTSTIVILAGLGTFIWFYNKGKEQAPLSANSINTISTKNGSRSKIELPDGSIVWLNSGSKLTYDKQFGVAFREVNLTGEGFFDVVHNADKPFIIHTAFFDIKDLGTQFNVKCYPEDKITETSLVEGRVEITVKQRPDEKYILKPDEKLVLSNPDIKADSTKINTEKKINHLPVESIIAIKPLTYLAEDSFSVETAWTYNKLSFDDEPFSEVAKKMGRWFDRKIEFRNKKLEDIHLSVSFINESFEQAMEALKYTNRFNYEIQGRQVIIY
ncbi:MAG: FecR family protein [Chitinophagaceae bacterium]|nr:FecR family protein [Chitinophagaceae bacterium]